MSDRGTPISDDYDPEWSAATRVALDLACWAILLTITAAALFAWCAATALMWAKGVMR